MLWFVVSLHPRARETPGTPLFPSTHSSHLCWHERAGWGRQNWVCPRVRETPGTPLFPSTHSSHLCSHEQAGWGRQNWVCPRVRGNPRYATVSINSFFASMLPWTGWVGALILSLPPGAGKPQVRHWLRPVHNSGLRIICILTKACCFASWQILT